MEPKNSNSDKKKKSQGEIMYTEEKQERLLKLGNEAAEILNREYSHAGHAAYCDTIHDSGKIAIRSIDGKGKKYDSWANVPDEERDKYFDLSGTKYEELPSFWKERNTLHYGEFVISEGVVKLLSGPKDAFAARFHTYWSGSAFSYDYLAIIPYEKLTEELKKLDRLYVDITEKTYSGNERFRAIIAEIESITNS